MGKLTRPPPIPELNVPGRLQSIVNGLFPQHPTRNANIPLWITPNDHPAYGIDRAELTMAARSLRLNTSPGPDGIPNEVLKAIVALNPDLLIDVYNTYLCSGVFPEIWKKARLVLLRKGDKPLDDPSSCRPLCLLDCLGKLFEKIIDNRLRLFLDTSGGLHERQFGFRKGRSTIDALEVLRKTVKTSKKKVGILTLDIRNAFNSAPWNTILEAVRDMEVPAYLQQIINSYLENRVLCFEAGGIEERMAVTCGVPQGSVLGPTLWNILYDGLLRTQLPPGVEYLAFADDVALVAKATDSIGLEQNLALSAQRVNEWLTQTGLSLAAHKCEAMVITNTRTYNDMTITIDGHRVESSKCVKYLGVHIDSRWRFSDHARIVAAKAGKTVQQLSRILPNISAARPTKRKLLSNVAHSILLYGSPIWEEDMCTAGWLALEKVQRRICLRVASAYCTTSTDALGVITGIAPLDLLAKERHMMHDKKRDPERPPTVESILEVWQNRWNSSVKGRWTHTLIPNIGPWINRRHGETDFHITQALSGHGCFAADLNRFGKLRSSECWFCGDPSDDAEHTLFKCDAWHQKRRQAELATNTDLNTRNLIQTMLISKENWDIIADMIRGIMKNKETEERRRQALQPDPNILT
ncbi:Reverse transcriptase domain-containing protein [Aphis craccivora]|uniref:Reverse transcriptase domain-containing protein n=1 Tax=Aphis craccivora TaxID=307492 RepID=A0A6G0X6R4_APHCR|nr:Reverse transcriptase domain-containing protein [Aphis craccivora]